MNFQASAYSVLEPSGGEYGVAYIPLVLGSWAAGRFLLSRAGEAYARHLNDKYDFTSVKPEEVLEQITLAENKYWLSTIIGAMGPAANRVQKAPTTLAQAYVKAAYLMALAARYLQNPGLAMAARATLGRIDNLAINSTDTGAIAQILTHAWTSVAGVAGARVDDPQMRALSVYFGLRPKGGSNLPSMAKSQQEYKLDDKAEGTAITDALTPGLTEEEKIERRRKRKKAQARAKKRKQRLMIYGGVGTIAVLGLAFLAAKGV